MTTAGTESVASSGEQARALEELQFVLGEGPTGEAFELGQPMLVADVTATRRWLEFAAAAEKQGVGAAYALPLQLGAVRLGVLTAYAEPHLALGPAGVARLVELAELVRDCLLDALDHRSDGTDGTSLSERLPLRTAVYQAQGMLMVALGVSLADALVRLRATAYAEGLDINTLADDLVNGRRLMPARDEEAK